MCQEVKSKNWDNILNDSKPIDGQWESLSNILTEARDKHVPHKLVDIDSTNKKTWNVPRTLEMKILGNKRDRQWTRYMESGNQSHYKQFCKHRNKVKKLSKANRKQYERKLASQAKTNPKAIYKYINSRLKIQKEITEVHIDCDSTDSELTDNKKIIVDIFVVFCINI